MANLGKLFTRAQSDADPLLQLIMVGSNSSFNFKNRIYDMRLRIVSSFSYRGTKQWFN
jgi:hypothetical protein